jgi:hypothetical protein
MKRRIEFTLNEAQLSQLIKKMVREAKDEMEDEMSMKMDFKDRGGYFDIMGAAKKVSKLFGEMIAPEMDDDELSDLSRMASRINIDRVVDELENSVDEELSDREEKASEKIEDIIGVVSESYLFEGKFDRIKSIIARANIFGGVGLLGVAGLAFISQIPGHVDFEFLDNVYDIVQSFGCSRYCGPFAFYIAVLGVIMYFKGRASKDYLEDEKASRRRGGMDERYFY